MFDARSNSNRAFYYGQEEVDCGLVVDQKRRKLLAGEHAPRMSQTSAPRRARPHLRRGRSDRDSHMSLNRQPSSLDRSHAFQRSYTANNSKSAHKFYTELLAMTRLAASWCAYRIRCARARWSL
eukprot:5497171-Pleurochrysis_carterae.AAC.1